MNKIVLASNNQGKLKEFNLLLETVGSVCLPQSDFGVPECAEPFFTFVENALTKARHASKITGLPALADDSGICVFALNGRPGVHSARFAQTQGRDKYLEASRDQTNNECLLKLLKNSTDRRAYYYCVLVLVRHPDDPQPIIVDGSWHGLITDQPQGENGFGYDPYFYLPHFNQTAAQLPHDTKNEISHRAQAVQKLKERLQLEQII